MKTCDSYNTMHYICIRRCESRSLDKDITARILSLFIVVKI